MDLTERKKAILSAIIQSYISTGEPVGSKMLCTILEHAPSSATLRNEMSALCEMGFLEMPHTSAGRVPTAAGYRLYAESLMGNTEVSLENKQIIDEALNNSNCDPECLPEYASQVLSDITGLPALNAKMPYDGITVKRIELLPMGARAALLILITSDGRSRSRLVGTGFTVSADVITAFDTSVTARLIGTGLNSITPAFMQNLMADVALNIKLMPLISTAYNMVEELNNCPVSLKGAANLHSICSSQRDVEQVLSIINSKENLMSLLALHSKPFGIIFGNDTGFNALKPSNIIFARYGVGGNAGCIGVIGPNRMSYEQIIPSIKYTALRMNSLICNTLKDMED